MGRSARKAGLRALVNGRWMTSVVLEVAPHIPIRSAETLRRHYGTEGTALADALVLNAARTTGAIGAAMGALATGAEASGAGVVSLPIPVAVDAILTALVEMKLIAELHEALGAPMPARGAARGLGLATAWASGRGVTSETLLKGGSVLASGAARRELVRLVRRKLVRRTGRSLSALAPALIGAVASATLNRRGTVKLAAAVRADIAGAATPGAGPQSSAM